MSSKKDSLTKQFKTQFLRQDLRARKTWLDQKSERSTERENEDGSENKETKETIDNVRMLAEGKDIMTLKIVRKRPFKQSNEAIRSQTFRTQHEVVI